MACAGSLFATGNLSYRQHIVIKCCSGVLDDSIDREKVMNALKKACLEELVDNLPKGIDTMIGNAEYGYRVGRNNE